ncbi:M50 family metallopeptidase [Alkalinema sp. FACHB-956]|nr:M50 family metallopeptidase [Alkalinema sp. FACHB-956]
MANFLLFQVMIFLMTIPHELGHAMTAHLVGMQVSKIVIGTGKTRWTFQFLGFPWEIKTILTGGITLLSNKSIPFYRSRLFLVILAGPLANAVMIFSLMQFPQTIVLKNISNTLLFPGLIFYIANAVIVVGNLFPTYSNIDGVKVPTDGMQLLSIPFLSQADVKKQVALAHVMDGQAWERRGQYNPAIDCFTQALTHDPHCVHAYQSLGLAYHNQGDYPTAIQHYNQAIDLDPQNAIFYFLRGVTYTFWRRTEPQYCHHALEDFNQAIRINSNIDTFYFLRAALNSYVGQIEQAIDDFTQVIHLNPSTNAYYNRGAIYYQSQNYSAALEDFDRAIKLDQQNLSAYYGRANAKYDLHDTTGALRDFQQTNSLSRSASINQQDEHGFYFKGLALSRLGDRASALQELQTSERLCLEQGNTQLLQVIKASIDF